MTLVERSNIMEVPYIRERGDDEEEEEEEENGVNLETRRKSKSLHQNISSISFTSSDTSVITTEFSNSSLEYSSSMEKNHNSSSNGNGNYTNNYTTTNGEKPKLIEGRSVNNNDEEAVESLSQADEKASVDESNKRENYSNAAHQNQNQNQDSNGTTARQKGVDGGFKDVESLLDESSSSVNATLPEIINAENTVNKIVIYNDQGEIVETSHSEDIEQEFEEYQVESVVKNQKTHDIICPNCKECITKRVILKRRKRKAPEPDHEKETSKTIDKSPQDEPISGRLDGISCFSCFRIFIPRGDGFLWWSFKPKQPDALQPGFTPREPTGAVQSDKDDTGSRFPLWFLNCCQPFHHHTEKPASELEKEPLQTPEDGKEGPGHKNEVPSPPSHADADRQAHVDTQPPVISDPGAKRELPPTSEPPRTPESGQHFPLWILNCCQPSSDKPADTDGRTPPERQSPAVTDPGSEDSTSAKKPSFPLTAGTTLPYEQKPSATHDKDKTEFPSKVEPKPTPDGTGVPHPGEPPLTPNKGTGVPHPEDPASAQINGQPSPQPEFPIKHDKEISSTTKPELSQSPTTDFHKVDIREEPHPSSSATQPEEESALGVKTTPLLRPHEDRGPGVSGLDIIKAIVYGGLVECISSLSVITSAAGGDATTLNIVALGLANVAGGLILLLHNLRVLIHEHTTDRYNDQLGRRDNFLLHAVVAVISYLVFGLLSPVIYGFSFRKSDNKDYKLATLAAAALVCITILSIGKAYVRRLPSKAYIQTILYYVSVGFMVSGVGYVAGDLINMLLKKLGVFDASAPVAMPMLEAGYVDGAWLSY